MRLDNQNVCGEGKVDLKYSILVCAICGIRRTCDNKKVWRQVSPIEWEMSQEEGTVFGKQPWDLQSGDWNGQSGLFSL